ncbi:MAG: hypothetical protein KF817_00790 [Phycisphaeraceae bacterium]|nr:hypothetical protein [Phycisphaeraceae bacterium]
MRARPLTTFTTRLAALATAPLLGLTSLPAAAQEAGRQSTESSPEPVSVFSVLSRSRSAFGSPAAIESLHAGEIQYTVATSVSGGEPRVWSATAWFAGLDRLRHVETRGEREFIIARNGEFAWTVLNADLSRRVGVDRAEAYGAFARMHRGLAELDSRFQSFEFAGFVDVDGEACARLRLRGATEGPPEDRAGTFHALFSSKSGRIVGIETPPDRTTGEPGIIRFEAWTQFGDLMLPAKIRTRRGTTETVQTITAFTPGEPDASRFEVPESVRSQPAPLSRGGRPGDLGAGGTGGGAGTGAPPAGGGTGTGGG